MAICKGCGIDHEQVEVSGSILDRHLHYWGVGDVMTCPLCGPVKGDLQALLQIGGFVFRTTEQVSIRRSPAGEQDALNRRIRGVHLASIEGDEAAEDVPLELELEMRLRKLGLGVGEYAPLLRDEETRTAVEHLLDVLEG